jgi:hypothetical protein
LPRSKLSGLPCDLMCRAASRGSRGTLKKEGGISDAIVIGAWVGPSAAARAAERERKESADFREAANAAAGSKVLDRAEWNAGLGRLPQGIRNIRDTSNRQQRRSEAARITNQAEAGRRRRHGRKDRHQGRRQRTSAPKPWRPSQGRRSRASSSPASAARCSQINSTQTAITFRPALTSARTGKASSCRRTTPD